MNLQIRDPRARKLASRLAQLRRVSMTEAVVDALEAEVARRESRETLEETIERAHAELFRLGEPRGHVMTKEEIDDMWGHPPDDV